MIDFIAGKISDLPIKLYRRGCEAMELRYETRDGKGNDIIKMVKIKEFPVVKTDFECPICRKSCSQGISSKKIVSSNFTDWAYIGNYICEDCTKLFSLYFYNYIVSPDEIKLINVRQLRDELIKEQPTPFKFVITTTQKKHLFYKSVVNNSNDRFAVNLETETIYTTHKRMKTLFAFVENLMTLKAGKKQMLEGAISFETLQKTGLNALKYLHKELEMSREIQIPLYCGQKLEITEEEALCNLDLILTK